MSSRIQMPLHRDQSGYVMVLFAISLVALVVLVGFGVDLGTWYLRATKLQRAADVAALSGSASLPDTTAANAAALASFGKNGFVSGGSITVSSTATDSDVTAQVQDSSVPTYFVKLFIPRISITRSSKAVHNSTVPLGNPFNIFGYGKAMPGMNITGPIGPQGFWAAINGGCMPKEDGDYFGAQWTHSKTATKHTCNNSAYSNPSYNSGGYIYMVDVPAGAPKNSITVWDGQFSGTDGGAADTDNRLQNDSNSGVDTNFYVYDITGVSDRGSGGTLVYSTRFQDGESPGRNTWSTLWTENSSHSTSIKRQYRVQVTNVGHLGSSYPYLGINTYTLMSAPVGTPHLGCSAITNPTSCTRVYGMGAVSVYLNLAANTTTSFYLAEIDPSFAGSTVSAYLFDPGEGAYSIELLAADGSPVNFTYSEDPVIAGEPNGPTSLLRVDGTGTQVAGDQGNGKFNDRLVKLTFTVPTSASKLTGSDGSHWWKLRYTTKPGSSASTDRITFGVNVGANSPSHLAKVQ